MIDKNQLIEEADLKTIHDKLFSNELRYRSHQWEGACPFCKEGHDCFHITDKHPNLWYCRKCERGGTAFEFVKEYYNLHDRSQFREAVDKLAELMGKADDGSYTPVQHQERPIMKPTLPETPTKAWQNAVMEEVIKAREYLWSNKGIRGLEYLRSRGFTDKTIRDYWIGYNPKFHELNIQHEGEPVRASVGYYIPTFLKLHDRDAKDSVLMRVKVRSNDSYYKYLLSQWESGQRKNKPEKYFFIRGSKAKSLFCAQYARPREGKYHPNIIYVEGEFDAMTINQTAGDICKAVTFGSHSYIGDAETWQSWYRIPVNTTICFDNDPDSSTADAVRSDERKLKWEIVKAQTQDSPDIRGNAPVICHLPEQYHDWNDILKLPNGVQIIRDILTEWFL